MMTGFPNEKAHYDVITSPLGVGVSMIIEIKWFNHTNIF